MTTIIKVFIGTVLAFLFTSCSFNLGVRGNGIVKTAERTPSGTFNEIEVSRGLDVYLTQSDTETITVQADENLHDIIKTEIDGNVLKIYAEDNINFSEAQKVMINFKTLSKISASSGSDVFSTKSFNADSITLVTASGSDMNLELNAISIDCNSSSGSDLKLSGSATKLIANASSGSDIQASNLTVETSHAKASSGADIMVNTSKELYASASSGGDIKYRGNPEKIDKTNGVSSSINED